ncbi:uncharacterized protein LOC141617000 [Silene latifolia]|uniref:uncharacterized protein LOC141617000 n=1 Tax=Silene latifolia TaxID=37657 RepID=UPI003D772251
MVAYNSLNDINQQYDNNTQHKSTGSIKRPATKASSNSQQPKVYKVKPIHFRQLVQELTGAQKPDPRRATLQSVAPPPLPLNPHRLHFQTQTQTQNKPTEKPSATLDSKSSDKNQGWEGISELNLSPNFQAWFNFAMLSPGPAPVSH